MASMSCAFFTSAWTRPVICPDGSPSRRGVVITTLPVLITFFARPT
jgi:hypothetical protein